MNVIATSDNVSTHPSGLTLIVEEQRHAPVVAFQVWVRVGSGDESPAEAGLAHVHEHMIFKGTEQRGVGEIAGAIESIGGSINAWTSFDQTVYHVVVPSRFADEGLSVLLNA
ncbi:MAG: zinc protease, partial [Flavobacteriales bacterium]